MSVSLGDIILYLGADDSKLGSTLKGVEGKAQSWVSGLGGKIAMGLGAIVTTAIGGATALGLAAFKAGGELDAAYDTMIIKSGASGEALNALQADFKAVFSSVPTQAQPAADVLSVLYQRLGLTGEQAQTTTKQILEMSRMMGVDATASAEAFTRMMGDAGLSAEEGSLMLDKIFVASQKSGIGLDRLMNLAVQFGSPMRLMGFSIDDQISLLAKWEKEGVNTELVMGSLRIAAGKFADEGKPLRDSLMDTFEAIKNNEDATAALALGMDVFGARAGPDMVAAIREGRFEIDDMIAALDDAGGAIKETSEKTMDWGEKLQKLKNKATLALEPIGMKLMDLASLALDKAGPALDWFAGVLEDYVVPAVDVLAEALTLLADGDIEGALAKIFGDEAAGKIMAFAGTISTFVNDTLLPFVREHWPEIQGALIGLGIALGAAGIVTTVTAIGAAVASLLTPMGLVIAVAALLGAAWAGNWGGIREKTAAALNFIKNLIPKVMNFITDFTQGRMGILSQIFNTGWNNIKLLFQAFQALFSGDFRRFGEILRQIWDNSWKTITNVLKTAWNNIKSAASTGIKNIISLFKNTDWGAVGKGVLTGIANGIKAGLQIIIDAAIAAAKAALEAALGFLKGGGGSSGGGNGNTPYSASGASRSAFSTMSTASRAAAMATRSQAFSGTSAALPLESDSGVSVQVNVNYQPMVTTSDEIELERILRPVIERILSKLGIRRTRGALATS